MNQLRLPRLRLDLPGMDQFDLPRMALVRQVIQQKSIEDIPAYLVEGLERGLSGQLKAGLAGKRVCLGVGSRGIPGLQTLVGTLVSWLKGKGANPFIIPAMGSHGGATAEGQLEVLASYGICQASLGVPVLSSVEVMPVGRVQGYGPVYCDRLALEADGLIVFNKVKPHSDFRGPHESGLTKMCAVGFGKQQGAAALHACGFDKFAELIPRIAEEFIRNCPVLFGVGVVENSVGALSEIELMESPDIIARDKALLNLARSLMLKIGFSDLDLLIIDEIGKNISGNGHDPNVTGRAHSPGFENGLNVKRLFIRGLSPQSGGNAAGLSLADITTRRVAEQVDLQATWTNALTAGLPQDGRLPMFAENDREAITLCLLNCPGMDRRRPRVVRIRNTADLGLMQISEALLDELSDNDSMKKAGPLGPLAFDDSGFLADRLDG